MTDAREMNAGIAFGPVVAGLLLAVLADCTAPGGRTAATQIPSIPAATPTPIAVSDAIPGDTSPVTAAAGTTGATSTTGSDHAEVSTLPAAHLSAAPTHRTGDTVVVTVDPLMIESRGVTVRLGEHLLLQFNDFPWLTPTVSDTAVLTLTSTTTVPFASYTTGPRGFVGNGSVPTVHTATFELLTPGVAEIRIMTQYPCEPACLPPDQDYRLDVTVT